ncbi:site-specific integrase [Mucilaginibacter sp. NFR10]|uniref:site-specific integrase n=1 Tax=Mucilaginibacter sp. NFR10 TaxID=1566292 RepID=UPI000871934B|nr:site-specific integrase [Mucilaginibacter sp. NFR10]SCW88427.1 Phage integrase family protein [Mucilaginibacter sp. NFR10]
MATFKHTVKFVLQQTKAASKLTPLRCFVRYNSTRSVFSSGIAIEPRYWNVKNQEPRQMASFKDGPMIAQSLKLVRDSIDIAFDHLTISTKAYPEPDTLRELAIQVINNGGKLPGTEAKVTTKDLFTYIDQVIADTKSGKRVKAHGVKYAPGTIRHYNSAYGVLKRFAAHKGVKSFKFDDITLDFYFELKEFAYQVERLSDNYFGTVVKFLKTCMNESKEEKLHTNNQYTSKRFVKVAVSVENVYLTSEQLETMLNHDFSKDSRLEKARDLFLLGCWTGLRFSDFTNIKAKNLSEDFIEIKTQKTGKNVAIPIHSAVKEIMSRYKGKTTNSLPPAISNVKLNAYIKEVSKEVGLTDLVSLEKAKGGTNYIIKQPLNELVSTHTARRAFASNMFKMGVPTIVIMEVTGHTTEKAFLNYIKVTPKEKAEVMREIWNRQTMKAISGGLV